MAAKRLVVLPFGWGSAAGVSKRPAASPIGGPLPPVFISAEYDIAAYYNLARRRATACRRGSAGQLTASLAFDCRVTASMSPQPHKESRQGIPVYEAQSTSLR
jgi:hypothetical protein